jgi:hypothetical protein
MTYSLKSFMEAIWESRWCGIVLTGGATIACALLFYSVPAPGVSVAVMGGVAAMMAARTRATGVEKATWMLIISALLVIEVAAIKKERILNEQADKLRTEEERKHFTAIGTGIEQTIGQGQRQFNQTLEIEKNNLARTLGGLNETVKAATGGDGFCFVLLTPAGYDGNVNNISTVVPKGKYPLTNVNALVTDNDMLTQWLDEVSKRGKPNTGEEFVDVMQRAQEWLHIGDLPPQFTEQIAMRSATVTGDKRMLMITFWANNGTWTESLGLRRVNGKWLRLIRVRRQRLDKKKNAFVSDVIFEQIDKGYPDTK